MSFVFYDTETTGTDTSFDQVLQFAAIRTDADLNELDRIELRCRLLPHIVPAPGALRVTKVTMEQLLHPSLPTHYEMISEIRGKLAEWSPSVFSGWNTLNFDEHLLRQAFYQCLYPPYLTNTGGNCRVDLMKIVQAASHLEPGCLNIPRGGSGRSVFKLDQLAPANGFNHANAHDAVADVEATIHIARLIRDRAPELWSGALRFSQKAAVGVFLEEEPAFVLTEHYFNKPYQFVLTKIGHEPDNEGVVYALDLTASLTELRSLSHPQLVSRLSRSPKLVRRIRTNSNPVLHAVDDVPGGARLSPEEAHRRAALVSDDAELVARLVRAFAETRPDRGVSEHVEEQLYGAFIGRDDEARMAAFHAADWGHRLEIVESFEDQRLVELGRRLIFMHQPESLPRGVRAAHERFLARRLSGQGFGIVPWTTLSKADADAQELLVGCSDEERAIIEGVRAHIAERMAFAQRMLDES